jgi:hypothetical protein
MPHGRLGLVYRDILSHIFDLKNKRKSKINIRKRKKE